MYRIIYFLNDDSLILFERVLLQFVQTTAEVMFSELGQCVVELTRLQSKRHESSLRPDLDFYLFSSKLHFREVAFCFCTEFSRSRAFDFIYTNFCDDGLTAIFSVIISTNLRVH